MPLFLKVGDIRGANGAPPSFMGWIELQSAGSSGSSAGMVFTVDAVREAKAIDALFLACMVGKFFPRAVFAAAWQGGKRTTTMLKAVVRSISTENEQAYLAIDYEESSDQYD